MQSVWKRAWHDLLRTPGFYGGLTGCGIGFFISQDPLSVKVIRFCFSFLMVSAVFYLATVFAFWLKDQRKRQDPSF